MQNVLNVYKPIGLTSLQLVEKVKQNFPEIQKISYAGRLDPLAHGVILLLVNDETKNCHQYFSLPKTYKFKVLFGISTDTYDFMGSVQKINLNMPNDYELSINKFLKKHRGKHIQPYPPYSSTPHKNSNTSSIS